MEYDTSIIKIKGIGEKSAALFHKLSIQTAGDLLHYYPRDYEEFADTLPISDTETESLCAVRACLAGGITTKKIRNLTILNFVIQDGFGQMHMTYFNTPYIRNILKKGCFYIFRGIVRNKGGRLTMEQAAIYQLEEYKKLVGVLQPKYALTAGLTNHLVTKAIKQVLLELSLSQDFLPREIIEKNQLISYEEAIHAIHFPADKTCLIDARKRLVFHEFFMFLFAIAKCKEHNEKLPNIHKMSNCRETDRLLLELPYKLTNAQLRVWEEIKQDLLGNTVMNRLVQGDVGSGKTILAFLSLLLCVNNACQGALMAPTEVLAKQHYLALCQLRDTHQLTLSPILLTGSMSAKEKRIAYEEIESGRANVIIGTHALIQEKVTYQKLALVVTDEQHRFGVRQRETFAGKGENVHVVVMSATPIPRTLAIILYGDLDISIVDELPAHRLPIKNCVVGTNYRQKAYQFMEQEIAAGRQVYVVCPMVEEGEQDNVENVLSYTEKLKSVMSPSVRIQSLHGKMRPAEKNSIMEEYAAHTIDILVSTTVIEVGINVPNATVMMVENAERFGLAQLHQLRGRVGRGKSQSYCIFVSGNEKKQTMERLDILNRSNDGFLIAEEDLKLRGPGDMFGIRQSGLMDFKIGDIYQDAMLLKQAKESVDELLLTDEALAKPEHALLSEYMQKALNQVDFRTI